MGEWLEGLLEWLRTLPAGVVYLVVGGFAALENLFPPVPADVVALFGGFLAGQGIGHPLLLFLLVWLANLATALLMYALGRRHGPDFFAGRLGRRLLRRHQLERMAAFYERRGPVVIFVSRFLPMFRALVPVFAGTSGVGFWRTALPMGLASALWYGAIVYLGASAGANWEGIRATLDASGRWLALAAVLLGAVVGVWWWRSRRPPAPGTP